MPDSDRMACINTCSVWTSSRSQQMVSGAKSSSLSGRASNAALSRQKARLRETPVEAFLRVFSVMLHRVENGRIDPQPRPHRHLTRRCPGQMLPAEAICACFATSDSPDSRTAFRSGMKASSISQAGRSSCTDGWLLIRILDHVQEQRLKQIVAGDQTPRGHSYHL